MGKTLEYRDVLKCISEFRIPRGVTCIGEMAFRECSSLTSIIIPEGVKSIEDYAFSRCTGLKSITIPDSVTSIGLSVFHKCKRLTIYTPAGSYAEQYAIENRIRVKTY